MAVRKNTEPKKNGHVKLIQLHMYQGSQVFPIFRATYTVIPLLPKAIFTPSIQPNLGLSRTRHQLASAITPCRPYGTHPFFPYAQTISILLICSTPNSLSPTPLFIPNSTQSWHSTQTSQYFISRTFTLVPLSTSHTPVTHSNTVGTHPM